jgi:hypothetical protein
MPSHQRVAGGTAGGGAFSGDLMNTIHGLDAKIKLISQRIKIIEKNEQIIGRTLVKHNKQLKETSAVGLSPEALEKLKDDVVNELKSSLPSSEPAEGASPPESSKEIYRLMEEFEVLRRDVDELRVAVKEAKYIMDSMSPESYVTVEDVSELVDEKLGKRKPLKRSSEPELEEEEPKKKKKSSGDIWDEDW